MISNCKRSDAVNVCLVQTCAALFVILVLAIDRLLLKKILADQCGISAGKLGGKDCISEVAMDPRIFHLVMA